MKKKKKSLQLFEIRSNLVLYSYALFDLEFLFTRVLKKFNAVFIFFYSQIAGNILAQKYFQISLTICKILICFHWILSKVLATNALTIFVGL